MSINLLSNIKSHETVNRAFTSSHLRTDSLSILSSELSKYKQLSLDVKNNSRIKTYEFKKENPREYRTLFGKKLDNEIISTESKIQTRLNNNQKLDSELNHVISNEIKKADLKLSTKSENILKKYLRTDMYKENKDYKDLNELMVAMSEAYNQSSKAQYKYFLENILNARKTDTNERLIENNTKLIEKVRSNLSIKENQRILQKYIYMTKNNISLEEAQELSKKVFEYEIKDGIDYLQNRARIRGNKIYSKAKYHEYKNDKKDRQAVFFTFTLNKGYRKYTLKKEYANPIKRKEVRWGDMSFLEENIYHKNSKLLDLLDKGYNELNQRMDYFTKNIQKAISRHRESNNSDDKNETITKILAFEFVKSVQFHTHLLVWVNQDELEILEKQFENYKNHFNMNEWERKAQDIEIIDKEKGSATTYLLKYILKQNEDGSTVDGLGEDEVDFYAKSSKFFGKKYNMIRMSKFAKNEDEQRLTQVKCDKIYNHIKSEYPDFLEAVNEQSEVPLYVLLEELYFKGIFEFIEEKRKRTTIDKKKMKEDYQISLKEDLKLDEVDKLDKKIEDIENNFSISKLDDLDKEDFKLKKSIISGYYLQYKQKRKKIFQLKRYKTFDCKSQEELIEASNYVFENKDIDLEIDTLFEEIDTLKLLINRHIRAYKKLSKYRQSTLLKNIKNKKRHILRRETQYAQNKRRLQIIRNLQEYVDVEEVKVITEATFVKDERLINEIITSLGLEFHFEFLQEELGTVREVFYYEGMLEMKYQPIQEAMYDLSSYE